MNDKDIDFSKLMTIKECEVRVENQRKKDVEEFEKIAQETDSIYILLQRLENLKQKGEGK